MLALRKVHVIIAVRNMLSAKEAKQRILEENESARVDIMKLDLCSLNSVTSFVDNFIALDLPLNILILVFLLILHHTFKSHIYVISEFIIVFELVIPSMDHIIGFSCQKQCWSNVLPLQTLRGRD